MATLRIELQKPRNDGTIAVKILLFHKGKQKRLPTSVYVTKNDLTKSGKIKNREISEILDDLIMSYRKKVNRLSVTAEKMSADRLATYLQSRTTLDFIRIMKDYIRENLSKKGIPNYRCALHSLIKFLGRDEMDISEVNLSFLQNYAASLKGRAQTLYLACIRHVFYTARIKYNDEDLDLIRIPQNPFARFKMPKAPVPAKRALDVRYIREIINLDYQTGRRTRYDLAKDCFILSFGLIGMNSVDLYNATTYKNGRIIYQRTKTKDLRSDHAEIEIDVLPHIEHLFRKYADETGKRVFKFYRMYASAESFNIAINNGLKAVGERIGVQGLQFYAARHSWATIARNDLGMGKDVINDALNHVDLGMTVTDVYIKKDFSVINKANKSVLDFVFQK